MVLYHIYSQEHRIRYFAHPCSTATLFQILCLLLTFLPPLFTGYFTGGYYYKELSYSEQPRVSFTNEYSIVIDSPTSAIFSSSNIRLNRYYQSTYYTPSVLQASLPQDLDGDDLPDRCSITIDLATPQPIQGKTIDLWLLFDYALNQYPLINLTALGYISLKVPSELTGSSAVNVYGQLRLQQNQPIRSYENDSSLQNPIIDYGTFTVIPAFDEIWDNYTQRNYYTTFDQQYVQWSSVPSATGATSVTITVIVNIGQQVIRYVPSFWREFRWSWIQYVAGLIPFMYVANKVKEFAFSTGLVRTVITKSL